MESDYSHISNLLALRLLDVAIEQTLPPEDTALLFPMPLHVRSDSHRYFY